MRKYKKITKKLLLALTFVCLCILLTVFCLQIKEKAASNAVSENNAPSKLPEELLQLYMSYIETGNFDEMYAILSAESKEKITKQDFITRNKKIYKGIEAKNICVKILDKGENEDNGVIVHYEMKLDSIAGTIEFSNAALFIKKEDKDEFALVWHDSLIFPALEEGDKVVVSRQEAKRGSIYDRNGNVLAGWEAAASVGVVPGKMEGDRSSAIQKIAALLEMSEQEIEDKLSQKWVNEDSFVPVKTLANNNYSANHNGSQTENILQTEQRKQSLLEIAGVMISDTEIRRYPLAEAASHLIGYIQVVTAEDLENHPQEDYSAGSVIGRTGMEALYEKALRGTDGHSIVIKNQAGEIKEILAKQAKKDGEMIYLTIDSKLQTTLYQKFCDDKSCSVALNPDTGEILALVSSPAYNSNDYITGMSQTLWKALNEDTGKPLQNRFRQKLCPGSSFKPIIAAIALETGVVEPDEDLGNEGLRWQKDSSWGNYFVTTLHQTAPANLSNALINSDNIYFAKLALRINKENLENRLKQLGFQKPLPFEMTVAESSYANTGSIASEIQLADSGYGQGQILVNPIHLAAMYTAFVNDGNVLMPYLKYQPTPSAQIWMQRIFSAENANVIKDALVQAVASPDGTAHEAFRQDFALAGKTGTAEIKLTKKDNAGTELGWFCVFTADKHIKQPILLLSMTEDVKGRGGSGYVVKKDKEALEEYLDEMD